MTSIMYGIVGFVWQMGYYEDDDINVAVSQIVRKYLRAVVVEGIKYNHQIHKHKYYT
jgi:hypothetical protein